MSHSDISVVNSSVHSLRQDYIELRVSIQLISSRELDCKHSEFSLTCSRSFIQCGFHLSRYQHIRYLFCSSKHCFRIPLIDESNCCEAWI